MNNLSPPTQEDIKSAWTSSSRRFEYPPIKETINIMCDTHSNWSRDGVLVPFVRIGAIPQHFHEAIHQLSRGSTCPMPDDREDSFYPHDVYRWLRALGIAAEFITPSQN